MKHTIRVLGIPLCSYESEMSQSELAILALDNTGGSFEFGFQPDQADYDEDDYEISPDDPEGFGFGVRQ